MCAVALGAVLGLVWVALVEIIVPVAVYAFKSVVENLSKNNRWPDKSGGLEGE